MNGASPELNRWVSQLGRSFVNHASALKTPFTPVRTPKASLLRSGVGLSGPRRLPRSDPLLGFWHFDYRHQLQSIIIFK